MKGHESKGKANKPTNKSIFVSSTFRDMQAERDALRDFVLPRVNEFAAKYGRAVEVIDLRWGVDTAAVSEAEQNHKVLRTCLDEIERSRPFFLGLIGDRYGWTPPKADMEAALKIAPTQMALDDLDKSVTALEIEYGALRSINPPVCLFYFRKTPNYNDMPEKLRKIYQDGVEGSSKLEKLKVDALVELSASYDKMAEHLAELGKTKEAGIYYRKALDARKQIYEQTDDADDLKSIIILYDNIGDNYWAQGLYDNAVVYRKTALDLFETYAGVEPSAKEYESYYRKKARQRKSK